MQIGIIGLGRMGSNMARRLLNQNHDVFVYNRSHDKVKQMENEGAIGTNTLEEFVNKLSKPRIIWLMLPAGEIIDTHIDILSNLVEKEDILIDGGNSLFKDSVQRYEKLNEKGIHFVDVGVSGGIWGSEKGYCLMIGGDKEVYNYLKPVLESLSSNNGYLYCGPSGSGHYVKMVHNGIEYALMEAYGEGFEMLQASRYSENLNMNEVAKLWNSNSIIKSWLLELLEAAFQEDPKLNNVKGYVEDSGEGRWNVIEAVESGISTPVIAQSLFKRFQSRQENVYSDKVIAALRKQFGGHKVYKVNE